MALVIVKYRRAVHHLVGIAEIAELLGVSKQRVHQLVRDAADFPEPEAVLSAGMIWRRDAILQWARETGRLPRRSS